MNKRYSVTQSQYNALLKSGVARSCGSCGHEVPKYVGRYSSSCNSCDDGILDVPQSNDSVDEGILQKASAVIRRKAGRDLRVAGKLVKARLSGNTDKAVRSIGTNTGGKLLGKTTMGWTAHRIAASKLPSKRSLKAMIGDSIESVMDGIPVGSVVDDLLQNS